MMSVHPIFILVSIWSGVIIFFSAVVAPTVFKSLEERGWRISQSIFPKILYFWNCAWDSVCGNTNVYAYKCHFDLCDCCNDITDCIRKNVHTNNQQC